MLSCFVDAVDLLFQDGGLLYLTSDVWRLSLEIDSPQSPEVNFSPDIADSLLRHDHDGKVLFVSDKTNPEKCIKVKD